MKNRARFSCSMALCCVLSLIAAIQVVLADAPSQKLDQNAQASPRTAFTYQGQLRDASGPVTGLFDLRFTLYTTQAGEQALQSVEHDGVSLTTGSFSLSLDFGPTALKAGGGWLEIAVRAHGGSDSYAVLTPRQKLTATPYAILAQAEPWSLIGVPIGFPGRVEIDAETPETVATDATISSDQDVKSRGSVKGDLTLSDGSQAALAPLATPNFIAKFGPPSPFGLPNFVDSIMFDNGANIGIGTTNPDAKLSIAATGDGARVLHLGTERGWVFKQLGTGAATALELTGDNPNNNNKNFVINTDGNVGVGTTIPGFKLDVAGTVRATSFTPPSDARLKTNVATLTNALEKLEQLRGVSFQWNETAQALGHASGQSDIGVIAQEVETVFPELVYTSNTDGYKAVDYSRLTAVLIEAVKELNAKDQTLQAQSEQRDQEVQSLSARLDALEQQTVTDAQPVRELRVNGNDALKDLVAPAAGTSAALAPQNTPNRLAKFDSTGRTFIDSIMFDNGTNVGIGTTSPVNTLQIGSMGGTGFGGNALALGDGTNALALHPGATGYLTARRNLVLGGGANTTNQLFLAAGGNVGIGTTNPAAMLDVRGEALFGTGLPTQNSGMANIRLGTPNQQNNDIEIGSTNRNLSIVSFKNTNGTADPLDDTFMFIRSRNVPLTSDARLKTNITPLTDALEKVSQIRGVSFEWNDAARAAGFTPGTHDIGVIAQDVEAVFPELVSSPDADGYKGVSYVKLTPVLIEAVKELKAENEELRTRLDALEQLVQQFIRAKE